MRHIYLLLIDEKYNYYGSLGSIAQKLGLTERSIIKTEKYAKGLALANTHANDYTPPAGRDYDQEVPKEVWIITSNPTIMPVANRVRVVYTHCELDQNLRNHTMRGWTQYLHSSGRFEHCVDCENAGFFPYSEDDQTAGSIFCLLSRLYRLGAYWAGHPDGPPHPLCPASPAFSCLFYRHVPSPPLCAATNP